MQYDRVIHGINRYIEAELYPRMSDWQEIIARIAVSRMLDSKDQFKDILMHNSFAKTFAIIDESGDVDVDGLIEDLHEQVSAKGRIEVRIPMFGQFCFSDADITKLHHMISEG